jgi:pantoate--beta-alanine ligase
MGAFHSGHLSLMSRARADCDVVVVSLFVNPTQFNDAGDLGAYPRDERRDAALAAEVGVDYLFAPPVAEVYPGGFATTVSVSGVSEPLEGAYRGRSHFDGVATVVTKLLNVVAPKVAYFGQKDAQQTAVIKQLVRELDIPVRIEVCPTIRDPDGVALSSRNVHLSDDERTRAAALHRALRAVQAAVERGERDPAVAIADGRAECTAARIEPEYLELVSPETMAPVSWIDGDVLAVVAARVGATRLIDNEIIHPVPTDGRLPRHRVERTGRAGERKRREPSTAGEPDMQRTMLKSKIHRATITDCDLHYVGSITIDPELLEAADIREFEQVAVVDINNGARFETYSIAGRRGSGDMRINGAAARLVQRGDTIIVISYGIYDPDDLEHYSPRVVHVNAHNEILNIDRNPASLSREPAIA